MSRTIGWMGAGTDLVLRALQIQAIWVLGTLAGGIALGIAPATMAAFDCAGRAELGEKISWSRAARVWRASFWRSQLTLGVPTLLVLLALTTVLSTGAPLAATAPAGIAAAVLIVALLHLPVIEMRYDVPTARVLVRSMVLAAAQLPTTLVMLAVLVLWGAIALSVPGLIPFLGVAAPVLVAHHLVSRSVQRNESLLEAPARAQDPSRIPGRPRGRAPDGRTRARASASRAAPA